MKNSLITCLLLFVVVCLTSQYSFSQYSKGNVLLGGTLSYQSVKFSGQESTNNFVFLPTIGYFVSDNISLGGSLGIGFSKGESPFLDAIEKTTDIYFGPVARFYKSLDDEKKFNFYLQTSVLFTRSRSKIEGSGIGGEGKSNGLEINIGPGFAYYPSKKIAIELKLQGLEYLDSNNELSVFVFDLSSFSPSVGFTILLN
jgi:hypothetical protein